MTKYSYKTWFLHQHTKKLWMVQLHYIRICLLQTLLLDGQGFLHTSSETLFQISQTWNTLPLKKKKKARNWWSYESEVNLINVAESTSELQKNDEWWTGKDGEESGCNLFMDYYRIQLVGLRIRTKTKKCVMRKSRQNCMLSSTPALKFTWHFKAAVFLFSERNFCFTWTLRIWTYWSSLLKMNAQWGYCGCMPIKYNPYITRSSKWSHSFLK